MVPAALLGLLEDDGLSAGTAVASAVAGYVDQRAGEYGELLGPIRVLDSRLAEVARCVRSADPLPVCAVNTTGAGGLVSLGARSLVGVDVVAVETALRDLDDLAGNVARVVAATRGLGEATQVYVDLPYAPGADRALDVVEAAGLGCAVRAGRQVTPLELAARLSALVEADVPLKTTGPFPTSGATVPDTLLVAVHALVEGASARQAADLLEADGIAAGGVIRSWDQGTAQRVRRRIRLVGCPSVPKTVARMLASGLLSRA